MKSLSTIVCLATITACHIGCSPTRRPIPPERSLAQPPVDEPAGDAEAVETEAAPPAIEGKNHLGTASSPYLLQHKDNPVHWYQWGPEAFAAARERDVPVLLSVGYSTCHWCHVMAHESFEDEEVAAYINAHFVAIKVDREERPDIDGLYMDVVQRLTGRGGWPMTVVMTPAQEPFFGGTYFPARDGDRGASKGFITILGELTAAWTTDRANVLARAESLSRAQAEASRPRPGGAMPGAEAIGQTVAAIARGHDSEWGGFGDGTKFPRPATLRLLLQYYRRAQDPTSLAMVVNTLDHMANGGIRDHIGGGFHRYTTDRRWRVPHFEKMLYDQAQLVMAYLDASQATDAPRFAAVADDTLRYVAKEMVADGGAFFSATDADSLDPQGEHVEGWFFTWTPDELQSILVVDDARVAAEWFDVNPYGDLDGRNILRTERTRETVATALGITTAALDARLEAIRPVLYAARAKRTPPHLDDKILTAWNGLMISAFARGSAILKSPSHLTVAERAASFILSTLVDAQGRLLRTYRKGVAGDIGYLDDHAFLIGGLLDLFEATSEPKWLKSAIALQERLDQGFWDTENGGYFLTSKDHETLLSREKPTYDGAVPSGNSVAIMNLLRLSVLTTNDAFRERAYKALGAFAMEITRRGAGSPAMVSALDFATDDALEVFIVAADADADRKGAQALEDAFHATWLPNRAFAAVSSESEGASLTPLVPGLRDKAAQKGMSTAYVCERGACQAPTSDPATLKRQLGRVKALTTEPKPSP